LDREIVIDCCLEKELGSFKIEEILFQDRKNLLSREYLPAT